MAPVHSDAGSDMHFNPRGQPVLCALPTAEILPVMSLRLWAESIGAGAKGLPRWDDGLEAAGLDFSGVQSFDMLGRSILAAKSGSLDVMWPCCVRLGNDESKLLDCLRCVQHRERSMAAARFADWLRPSGAQIAFALGCHLSECFRGAGLWLPERDLHPGWNGSLKIHQPTLSTAIH